MKVLAFVAIVGAAVALPAPDAPLHVIPILTRSEVRDDAGQYALSYSTGNGIALAEQGALKQTPDGLDNVLVKQVSFILGNFFFFRIIANFEIGAFIFRVAITEMSS